LILLFISPVYLGNRAPHITVSLFESAYLLLNPIGLSIGLYVVSIATFHARYIVFLLLLFALGCNLLPMSCEQELFESIHLLKLALAIYLSIERLSIYACIVVALIHHQLHHRILALFDFDFVSKENRYSASTCHDVVVVWMVTRQLRPKHHRASENLMFPLVASGTPLDIPAENIVSNQYRWRGVCAGVVSQLVALGRTSFGVVAANQCSAAMVVVMVLDRYRSWLVSGA